MLDGQKATRGLGLTPMAGNAANSMAGGNVVAGSRVMSGRILSGAVGGSLDRASGGNIYSMPNMP